jgi:ABC-2 type transport system ATP-binding protein
MLQESGTTGVLTVREIVALFGAYYPSPLPTDQAVAMAGLADKADARISTLSGGQRQRLYFALAICGNPEILFLDEPTVGMDIEARRAFVASIQALAAAGKTVVFTTHYLREAEELARRIVVVDHGQIIADATPRELMSKVAAKRVSFEAARPLPADTFGGLALTALDLSGRRVRFLTNEPETILRALFERGVEMRDLEVAGADLEEAFLSLTRRPARA